MTHYSIDLDALHQLGERLEREYDLSKLQFCGEPVWNAVRVLLLGTHNWSFGPRGTIQAAKRRRTMPIIEQLRSMQKHARRERPLRPVDFGWLSLYVDEQSEPGADILLFDAIDLLRLDTEGRVFSRIFDYFHALFEGQRVVSALGHDPTLEKAFHRRPTVLYAKPADAQIYPAKLDREIEGLDELMKVLDNTGIVCPFTADQLASWVRSVYARSEAFLQMLDALSPKLVMLTSFKSSDRMALVRACKLRGVPTVEVQHGLLGPEYRGLGWVSPGRDWIPDYFWLWGEQSAAEIRPLPPRTGPEMIVAGNFELLEGARKVRPLSEREPGAPRILFIEQYTHSHTVQLLAKVQNELRARDLEASLMLRLHPRSVHLKKTLTAELADKGLVVEMENATSLPLYTALELADVIVVESSTVAYEASAVGRHVVVYGPTGGQLFVRDIKSGAFRFAPDVGDVGREVMAALRSEPHPTDFFNTDLTKARAAIARLRGIAQGNP